MGTPSDISSLGLVLYKVLTGVRAQVADTTSPLALSRTVWLSGATCRSPFPAGAGPGQRVRVRRARPHSDAAGIHRSAPGAGANGAHVSREPARGRRRRRWSRAGTRRRVHEGRQGARRSAPKPTSASPRRLPRATAARASCWPRSRPPGTAVTGSVTPQYPRVNLISQRLRQIAVGAYGDECKMFVRNVVLNATGVQVPSNRQITIGAQTIDSYAWQPSQYFDVEPSPRPGSPSTTQTTRAIASCRCIRSPSAR